MIKELDSVVLAVDLPAHRLKAGDVGTVVHVHGGSKGFEVEFVALDSETIARSDSRANSPRLSSSRSSRLNLVYLGMQHLLQYLG